MDADGPRDVRDVGPDSPLVLVAKVRGALRLGAVSPAAQALGLTPGMTLADARAVQPDLAVADMDESADRQFLKRVGQHCIRWSPRVLTTGSRRTSTPCSDQQIIN